MKLYIAAIVHSDPLCRARLRKWLVLRRQEHSEEPEFIAVEWDSEIFEQIRMQRPDLRQMAQKEWPNASPDLLDTLANALAFEADTHVEQYPMVEVLWLDQGRLVQDKSVVTNFAQERMRLYKSYLPRGATNLLPNTMLEMSREAWRRSGQPTPGGNDRDPIFAQRILEKCETTLSSWAVIIVGAKHASDAPGCMRARLQQEGVICEVAKLNPNNGST